MFMYKLHVWMEGLLVPGSQDQLCPWLSPNSTLPREVDAKKKADPGAIGGRLQDLCKSCCQSWGA